MNKKDLHEKFFVSEVWVHYNHILKFLYTLTTDRYLTDDLAQETMFRCWRKIETVRGYKDVKAAMTKIAKNQFNQYIRDNKVSGEDLYEPEMMRGWAFSCCSNIEEFIKKEGDIHEFLLIFSGIRREYVQVVILADYYGFSIKEISALLRKNYNTVVSHHARGLEEMRKKKHLYNKLCKGELDYD